MLTNQGCVTCVTSNFVPAERGGQNRGRPWVNFDSGVQGFLL